jgi:integrase
MRREAADGPRGKSTTSLLTRARSCFTSTRATEWSPHALVFTTSTGRAVEPRNLARSFDRIVQETTLRRIRLHDLRRTTATLLKSLGVPPLEAMEILGHSRIAVTLEVYTAADRDSRREAIGRIAQLFESDRS